MTNLRGFGFKRKPFILSRLLMKINREFVLHQTTYSFENASAKLSCHQTCLHFMCNSTEHTKDSHGKLISRLFQYTKLLQMGKKDS